MKPSPIPCKIVILDEDAARKLIEADAKNKQQFARAPDGGGHEAAVKQQGGAR